MKSFCNLIVPVLILASVLTLSGRVRAPVIAATPSSQQDASNVEASSLGELTSGDIEIDRMIVAAGVKYSVDAKLVYYVIRQESAFKPSARSSKDAQGLMQIIAATAERFKVENRYDSEQNIDGGVHYLKWLLKRFDGDIELALAGYNAGEGSVAKCGNKIPDYKETKSYVQEITAAYGKPRHPVSQPG